MLPWGHAAVGYLLYAGICRHRGGKPEGAAVLALAVGTQFADLLDKPLAWYLGALPSGRSLGHSVFVAVLLLAVLHGIATRYNRRELSVAFAVGHLLHLAGDTVYPLARGPPEQLRFFLWPVIPQPGTEANGYSILELLIELTLTVGGAIESLLFIAATVLWLSHRAPGLWLCLGAPRALGNAVQRWAGTRR